MILARDSITIIHIADITSVTWYYKLQASTASPPEKPTTATPSGWTTTEPQYTEGSTNSLYICQKTTLSDGTFAYSDVSLSSTYEAAKAAYNKSVQALDAVTPIESKTYTGLIGTANSFPGANFFFGKIHPESYSTSWRVKLRIRVIAPEAYSQQVDIEFGGYGSTFSSYNSYTSRTGNIGFYYVELLRATQAGITAEKGHMLGIGLNSSTNPANASYKRTIIVDLLETYRCTVNLEDTAVAYSSMDGYNTTYYNTNNSSGTPNNLTQMAVGTTGQNATNNTNTHYTQYGNAVKVGAFGVKRYTLLMKDTDETWVSFVNQANSTATTKTVSDGGHKLGKLLYSAGGAEYASGANTSTVYDAYPFDLRYSTNCGSTLTAYKAVYLVGTIGSDGLFYFDTTTWWTQTVPTTSDGKTYVYVGDAYSTYQVWLSTENDAWQYYEGKFRRLSEVEEMKAAKTATNYLSVDNAGIMVADMTNGETYAPSEAPSGVKNTFIDNDSFNVRDGQTKLASFGLESQIGTNENLHLKIKGDGLYLESYDGKILVKLGSIGTVQKQITVVNEDSISTGGSLQNRMLKDIELPVNVSLGTTAHVKIINTSVYTQTGDLNRTVTLTVGTAYTESSDTTNLGKLVYDGNRKIRITGSGILNIRYEYDCYVDVIETCGLLVGSLPSGASAMGDRSINVGDCNDTTHKHCGSVGYLLKTGCNRQFVTGFANTGDSTHAFEVGNGECDVILDGADDDEYTREDTTPSNAFAVGWDGNLEMALDTSAASGTDHDLYAQIVANGWGNEVIT